MDARFLWDYLAFSAKPKVLYGTGDGADKILDSAENYGVKIAAVFASDDFAKSRVFRGYNVETLSQVEQKLNDFIILVAFGSDKPEVLDYIYELADKREVYAPDVPVAGEGVYTPDYIIANNDRIAKARSLFADDKSRETFDAWLDYRISGDISILEGIAVSRKEVTDLLGLLPNREEVFVDIGAYKGDTVGEFLRLTEKRFKKIIAVEPNARNYMALRRAFYAYGSGVLKAVNAAVTDADGETEFLMKSGRGAGTGKRGVTTTIPTVKLDTLCKDEAPTYVKIDAEGAESAVLRGGKDVIKKCKPKMITALYHRAEDMFELPIALNALNPKYRMFLRKTRCLPGWEFNLISV